MSVVNIENSDISPARSGVTIASVKSDTVDLVGTYRAVHVNTDGVIRGILLDDSATNDFTVLAGNVYPYKFSRIYSTGTTATGIVLE